MFEKNSWEKPAATAGGVVRFGRLRLDQFNFSITRISLGELYAAIASAGSLL